MIAERATPLLAAAAQSIGASERASGAHVQAGADTAQLAARGVAGPSTALVSGGEPDGAARPRAIDDPQTIVESAPPQVSARWFVEKDGDLVPSSEFERWKAGHEKLPVGHARLLAISNTITRTEDGKWDLEVSFTLDGGAPRRQWARHHHFFVERGAASSLGAQVKGLRFEPYNSLGDAR